MEATIKKIWDSGLAVLTNVLKLEVPYWLSKDIDHVLLLKFFVSTILVVFGYGTLSKGLDKVPELVNVTLVLVGFATVVAGLIYSFVPCPAPIPKDSEALLTRLKDIGILSPCFSMNFYATWVFSSTWTQRAIQRFIPCLKHIA
jgi:hypothetical protein